MKTIAIVALLAFATTQVSQVKHSKFQINTLKDKECGVEAAVFILLKFPQLTLMTAHAHTNPACSKPRMMLTSGLTAKKITKKKVAEKSCQGPDQTRQAVGKSAGKSQLHKIKP